MAEEPRTRIVVRLKRDTIIKNLPCGIGTPLAAIVLEPGVTLEQMLAALPPGPAAGATK